MILTVRKNKVGRTGSSTSWFITTARMSDRKMSVMEKHTPIAAPSLYQRKLRRKHVEHKLPSMAAFKPISFSDSCNKTMSSAGVRSSLCRTRGKLDVTVPKLCGGVATIELKTERTKFLGVVLNKCRYDAGRSSNFQS